MSTQRHRRRLLRLVRHERLQVRRSRRRGPAGARRSRRSGGGWVVDASLREDARCRAPTTPSSSVKGTSVSVSVDGALDVSFAYNAAVVDGGSACSRAAARRRSTVPHADERRGFRRVAPVGDRSATRLSTRGAGAGRPRRCARPVGTGGCGDERRLDDRERNRRPRASRLRRGLRHRDIRGRQHERTIRCRSSVTPCRAERDLLGRPAQPGRLQHSADDAAP